MEHIIRAELKGFEVHIVGDKYVIYVITTDGEITKTSGYWKTLAEVVDFLSYYV